MKSLTITIVADCAPSVASADLLVAAAAAERAFADAGLLVTNLTTSVNVVDHGREEPADTTFYELVDQAIQGHPGNKIEAIKELRRMAGIGLKEAKEAIEGAWTY